MAVLPTSLASDASAAARLLDDLVAKPGRSASMLLKDPATNTDESWHLCLPAHFNTALGLRFSCKQKVKNKQVVDRWREWSQGSHFCFNEGSIIYDRDVSGLTTWAEKLEAVDFFIVLGPTKPVTIRTLSTDTTGPRRIERDPGSVCFRIFFQDPDNLILSAKMNRLTRVSSYISLRMSLCGLPSAQSCLRVEGSAWNSG